MDLNYLRRLVKIFDDSSASELNIEEDGVKIHLAKPKDGTKKTQPAIYLQSPAIPNQEGNVDFASAPVVKQVEAPKTEPKEDQNQFYQINSPIVGTFYRAPAPDQPAFVEIGAHINTGATLCIIEAMKLMNEIESDISGTVIKFLVQNGQPVEYGQPLFLIQPD